MDNKSLKEVANNELYEEKKKIALEGGLYH